MDVSGHVPPITAGIPPAPGGSTSNLEEEEFPALAGGKGVEMAIKTQSGCRTYHSEVLLPNHAADKVAGKGREPEP